jgi:TatD DNase family protein
MHLVDSHAHIYLDQFAEDIDEVLGRAREAGVEQIYMPNIDHTSIDAMLELAEQEKGYCRPMMGLHPCSVGKNFEKELYLVEDWLKKADFSAVGEIGTDLYWDKTYWQQQVEALKIQLELARQHQLPFVIHCRDSIDETIVLVEEVHTERSTGVFHCFTGNLEQAKKITALGYKLGIGGVATFKNGGLEDVLRETALEHLLLETDSPYLAPTPNRGKRNEPAYVALVCDRIAAIKNIEPLEVARVTSENAKKIFKHNGY